MMCSVLSVLCGWVLVLCQTMLFRMEIRIIKVHKCVWLSLLLLILVLYMLLPLLKLP